MKKVADRLDGPFAVKAIHPDRLGYFLHQI